MATSDWLKVGISSPNPLIFAATIWWAWRHRNQMCLSNELWPLSRLALNIQNMVDTLTNCFTTNSSVVHHDRFIRWNSNNHSCVILNVDGSCLGSPLKAGYGGVLRNNAGFYLSGFSGHIQDSSDILYAELYAIYQGLILPRNMNIEEIVCYSDSLLSINLINGPIMWYHVYDVLIQDVKDLVNQSNVTISHTLREGNHCVNFVAKLGASSDLDLYYHTTPLDDLLHLLRMDAAGTLFSR